MKHNFIVSFFSFLRAKKNGLKFVKAFKIGGISLTVVGLFEYAFDGKHIRIVPANSGAKYYSYKMFIA